MTRTSPVYFAALVLAATPLVLAGAGPSTVAQTRGVPTPQATQSAPSKSTALILGQVTDGSSGQPIPEAVVLLSPSAPGGRRGGGAGAADFAAAMAALEAASPAAATAMAAARGAGTGPPSRDQRVITGSDGRFLFHTLPPGQYQLSVSLAGFASSLSTPVGGNPMMFLAGMGRGAAALSTATAYAVAEGQILEDVRLRLWRYAAVAGTVLDEAGEPAVGLIVQAMRRTMMGGRARYAPAGSGRTDDRGAYRIGALLPGDYLVVMPQMQIAVPAAMIENVARISVTGTVDRADPGMAQAFMQLVMASPMDFGVAIATGVRVGDYMVASGGGVLPHVRADGRLLAYQTAFYAGAATPVDAAIVSLKSGDERADADFRLRLTPTVRVSGIAMGPDGPVPNLLVRLVVPGDRIASETEFDVATSMTSSDGRFSFYAVPPGQFLLRMQRSPLPFPVAFAAGSDQPLSALFAVMDLTVGPNDIDGLTVNLAEAFSVSGRVEVDPRTGAAPPATLKGVGVQTLPADGQVPNMALIGQPAQVGEDRTFVVRGGLTPGRYFLNLVPLPPPWQVASATIDGRDVYDAPLEVRTGDPGTVVVTLTDRLAQISGGVLARAPLKPDDVTVMLFPANYQAWIEAGMNPRLARTARATSAGSYTILGLTRGDYFVIAIDRSDEGSMQDPAFIERLSRGATRVTIGTEPRTQPLSVVGVGR